MLWQTCPECFREKLFQNVCQNCGAEPSAPNIPREVNFEQQGPANRLQPGNGLGSVTEYREVGFESNPVIISRRMERDSSEDSLIKNVKSDLMDWLRNSRSRESVSDLGARLVEKEVIELKARFPLLETSKNARRQVFENVKARLTLLYPFLERPASREECEGVISH
jgi:hypothetical protein